MRIETRRSDGYVRIRSWEDGRDVYAYLHRLNAVAWGILEGLEDPRHVHHRNGVPWDNTEGNLEAVEPPKHAIVHHAVEEGSA